MKRIHFSKNLFVIAILSLFTQQLAYGQELPKNQTKANTNKNSLEISVTKGHHSDSIRQLWKDKGGILKSNVFKGGVSYLSYKTNGIALTGAGFNLGFSKGQINFKAPAYKSGTSSWSSFSYFGSIDVSRVDTKVDIEGISNNSSIGYINWSLALQLGYVKGIGSFVTETNWKGLIFGINYKPSLNLIGIDVKEGSDDTQFNFNYTSFSIDISSASFNAAMDKIAPKAGYKFSVFVLPPINDKPLFVNASLGITLYK